MVRPPLLRSSVVGVAALAAALTTALTGATTTAVAAPAAPNAPAAPAVPASQAVSQVGAKKASGKVQEPGVTVSLWEWSWRSIASECPRLATIGYDGVQVAPPQDSVKRTAKGNGSDAYLHPWWEVYQAVDYSLTSRMGDEQQFRDMVSACRKVGVKVYVDAVINHTTGQGSTSYGGVDYTPYTYAKAGYVPDDFHYNVGACPSTDGGVQDYNSKTQVWNCNLVGLEDLRTETPKVQGTLAAYLNKLIRYGVSGFRVDAGKHVPQADLDAIYAQLTKTKDGVRPYWVLEIGPGSPGVLSPQAYTSSGDVLGLDGVQQIFKAFKSYQGSGNVGDISGLATFGAGSGLTRSSKTLSFVTNHDTNHDPANALTYKDGAQYQLATEWLLADGYGSPQVFSSFAFGADTNQGPPADAEGIIDRASCANGRWTCDHARPEIAGMVKFHQYVGTARKKHVYDDELNVLAFGRGSKGWAAFNNSTGDRRIVVKTGLKEGRYCDLVTGRKVDGSCSGVTVEVREGGRVNLTVPPRRAVAITRQTRLKV
ncbi:alpha-amylase [Microlunatus flavus]|uniref:Alpha-amylase n=1 Tax=Microlunatus flavus TaxID=1036181 RepID=A0A1H9EVJ7_9ACTN|nr:alpha-amylase family protein [Microlunatus flavus]SEQ29681.1 alpha-amylase [Microlunatus flavus]